MFDVFSNLNGSIQTLLLPRKLVELVNGTIFMAGTPQTSQMPSRIVRWLISNGKLSELSTSGLDKIVQSRLMILVSEIHMADMLMFCGAVRY